MEVINALVIEICFRCWSTWYLLKYPFRHLLFPVSFILTFSAEGTGRHGELDRVD